MARSRISLIGPGGRYCSKFPRFHVGLKESYFDTPSCDTVPCAAGKVRIVERAGLPRHAVFEKGDTFSQDLDLFTSRQVSSVKHIETASPLYIF